MADARILHKKAGQGERVVGLSHLAYRVWTQYLLSADDYGVMRASVSVLAADNPRLEQEPTRSVHGAMLEVEKAGLVRAFQHQGQRYWWQPDWQDFQDIRHPRKTVNPLPPETSLVEASEGSRNLFRKHSAILRKDFGKVSEEFRSLARAGTRETLTLTSTEGSGSSDREIRDLDSPAADAGAVIVEPSARRYGPPIMAGDAYHMRNCPPWGIPACKRGFCIPKYLWPQWERRMGAGGTDALGAFVAAVMSETPPAAGDRSEEFWPRHFAARFGSSAPAPVSATGRGSQTRDAVARAVQRVASRGGAV